MKIIAPYKNHCSLKMKRFKKPNAPYSNRYLQAKKKPARENLDL